MIVRHLTVVWVAALLGAGVFPRLAFAQQSNVDRAIADEREIDVPTAPVVVDGFDLFNVRGSTGFPAEARAAAIASRIRDAAADASISVDDVIATPAGDITQIAAGPRPLLQLFNADAAIESVGRDELASIVVVVIRKAINGYRADRAPTHLQQAGIKALVATVVLIGLLWLGLRALRWFASHLEVRYRARVKSVGIQSFNILERDRIWTSLQGALGGVRLLTIVVLAYFYFEFVFGQFPWTRRISVELLDYVVVPLASMGMGFAKAMPSLIFLVLLFFVTRMALRLIKLFFNAVESGGVKLREFEPDWAQPTYRMIRIGVVAFALVVAYPYIPGSESDAFKGVSIFLGVLFSIGSSSFVSNFIAGYAITYRRLFKVGHRVKVDDVIGDVSEVRLQVTHLRTVKNEEVIIPNSEILNRIVTNYSTFASRGGLILHTTVGIGYETPWRQVEAMLLLSAQRTVARCAIRLRLCNTKNWASSALPTNSTRSRTMPRRWAACTRQCIAIFSTCSTNTACRS